MKKLACWGILPLLLLVSCLDPDLPHINGMWQLKSIANANGSIEPVDTVYYSFQRQAIFSYTITDGSGDPVNPFFGYIDFPANDKVHIELDPQFEWVEFPPSLQWDGIHVTYNILKINSKELILGKEGVNYNFIKF
jgi:hypothetical protein